MTLDENDLATVIEVEEMVHQDSKRRHLHAARAALAWFQPKLEQAVREERDRVIAEAKSIVIDTFRPEMGTLK